MTAIVIKRWQRVQLISLGAVEPTRFPHYLLMRLKSCKAKESKKKQNRHRNKSGDANGELVAVKFVRHGLFLLKS